jgi:photosystem II stability/assembly factor-like uncharacterized protein
MKRITQEVTNPDIVWVGTGENNPRNSVSYGDGVYKSTDGGKTWTNMGLKKTFQIGEIVIHPTDPETVYVGALGRLYGNNEERGVFKTTDGGKTWEKCFYVDDRTGIIEMQMHPTDPNTLIATAWERLRDGFDSWPVAIFLYPKATVATIRSANGALGADCTKPPMEERRGGN